MITYLRTVTTDQFWALPVTVRGWMPRSPAALPCGPCTVEDYNMPNDHRHDASLNRPHVN